MKVELSKMKITYAIHSWKSDGRENTITSDIKICGKLLKGKAINHSHWGK